MKRLIAFSAVLLLILSVCAAVGQETTLARFTDRYTETVYTSMGIVDIELDKSAFNNRTASAGILNRSNIAIYLRAGIIIENTTDIMDTGQITITAETEGWKAIPKQITGKDGQTYTKWFLEYKTDDSFTRVAPGTGRLDVDFTLSNAPEGYEFTVHIVPEAVQADENAEALRAALW